MQPSTLRVLTEATLAAQLAALPLAAVNKTLPPIGWYFAASDVVAVGNSTVAASGAQIATRLIVPSTISVDTMAVQVTTLAAGRNLKTLLYSSDGYGMPSSLFFTSPAFSLAATGAITQAVTLNLAPGIYWIVNVQDATSTAQVRCCQQRNDTGMHATSSDSATATPDTAITFDAGTYTTPNAVPATVTATPSATTAIRPHVAFRRSQ